VSEAVRDGVGDEASDGMSDKVSYEVSEAVRDGVGDEASDEVSDKVSDTGNDEGEGDSIACWSTDKSERGSPDGRCFREKKLLSSSLCFLSSSIHIHSLHCVSFGSSLDLSHDLSIQTLPATSPSPRPKMSHITTQASTRVDRVTMPPNCSQVVPVDREVKTLRGAHYLCSSP